MSVDFEHSSFFFINADKIPNLFVLSITKQFRTYSKLNLSSLSYNSIEMKSCKILLKIFSQVHNGTKGAYIDPDAPVHIVTGSAVSEMVLLEFL